MYRSAYNLNGSHTEALPRLHSYAEAIQHYNSITPLRSGKFKGQRPLGMLRRYTRSMIRLVGDGANTTNPAVILSYYQNDVMQFNPDNTVVVSTCGWPSLSTLQFFNDILRGAWGTFVRKNRTIYYVENGQHHLVGTDNTVTIDLNTGKATGGDSVDTYVLIKPEMRNVRKEYREFLQYAHNCLAMSVSVPLPASAPNTNVYKSIPQIRVTHRTLAPLQWASRYKGESEQKQCDIRERLFSSIKDTSGSPEDKLERYYEAFKTIALATVHYLPYSYRYSNVSGDAEFKCNREYFDNLFTGMLKMHYADRLFQKTTATSPMPKIPSISNAFYIEFQNY